MSGRRRAACYVSWTGGRNRSAPVTSASRHTRLPLFAHVRASRVRAMALRSPAAIDLRNRCNYDHAGPFPPVRSSGRRPARKAALLRFESASITWSCTGAGLVHCATAVSFTSTRERRLVSAGKWCCRLSCEETVAPIPSHRSSYRSIEQHESIVMPPHPLRRPGFSRHGRSLLLFDRDHGHRYLVSGIAPRFPIRLRFAAGDAGRGFRVGPPR